ncbi:MAG: hypothetical protein EPO45_17305 [Sphingobium sp.]|nr:MAG: hypothetical protein EPO45_17305 [Sphingobium sp.]
MSFSSSTRTINGPSNVLQADKSSGSLDTILRELFRIAQRAGACRLHVETFDYEGRPTLSVLDNGSGIDSPRALLPLDTFGWRDARPRSRNPDGIALSSLFGRHTIVRSGPDETEPAWSVTIPAEAWKGEASIAIEPDGGLCGANIMVEIPEQWRAGLEDAVAKAARHSPMDVFFHARCKNPD